jgi:hypothetical protein
MSPLLPAIVDVRLLLRILIPCPDIAPLALRSICPPRKGALALITALLGMRIK